MKYHVTYQIDFHPEGLEREQVPEDRGAGDSVFFASVIYEEDGSESFAFMSVDGRAADRAPLESRELFKIWVLLARNLSHADTLSESGKDLCRAVFEHVRDGVLEVRKGGQN